MKRATRFLLVLLAGLALGACSRSVSVAPQPGTTYAILVNNQAGRSLDVAWSDGDAWRSLGTVASGTEERFIIAAPRTTTISVRGTSGATTSGPYSVTLTPGSAARVTLR